MSHQVGGGVSLQLIWLAEVWSNFTGELIIFVAFLMSYVAGPCAHYECSVLSLCKLETVNLENFAPLPLWVALFWGQFVWLLVGRVGRAPQGGRKQQSTARGSGSGSRRPIV